jgi:hypothetical protein
MSDVLTVRCGCGWEVTGGEDEIVASTLEHGSACTTWPQPAKTCLGWRSRP